MTYEGGTIVRTIGQMLFITCLLILLAAGPTLADAVVLDFAHATTGGAWREALTEIIREFEESHPDITIRENAMKDEIYETVGLVSLFHAGTPPDVYFQWGGWLVERDVSEGWAAKLDEELARDSWKDSFSSAAWDDATVGGEIYMVPHGMDITNLVWYNADIFARYDLQEPETWEEFMDLCQTLKDAGYTPIAAGNKGVGWPMGNWAGHLVSRVIGESAYDDLLKLEEGTSFSDPGVVEALGLLADMVDRGFFNIGVNVIDASEARMSFFMEQAVMHPIGSWLVSSARRDAPELNYAGFDTPAIDGQGDQSSMIGLTVGYMIAADSPHFDEAAKFLRHLTSVEMQRYRVEHTGEISAVRGTGDAAVDPRFELLVDITEAAGTTVAPPDTGYELEVAYAFYDAAAKVMDGIDPAQALQEADEAIAHLR